MKVAVIEFGEEVNSSPMLSAKNRSEELRADSIDVGWQQHHIVFNLLHNEGKSVKSEMIAFLATDVSMFHIFEEK